MGFVAARMECASLHSGSPPEAPSSVSKRSRDEDADDGANKVLRPHLSGAVSAGMPVGHPRSAISGCARTTAEAEETFLFVDAMCGQLDELKRVLSNTTAKVQADRETIVSLQSERDRLRAHISELQAASMHAAASPSGRPQPVGARKPRGVASVGKQAQNSSVIVLDSDDEMADTHTHTQQELDAAEEETRQEPDDQIRDSSQVPSQAAGGREGGGNGSVSSSNDTRPAEDEELVFVSSTGELAGDLPHPRNLCPRHKFWAVGDNMENVPADKAAQNRNYCENCYCFLCDVHSSSCRTWSTDNGLSHCNAHAGVKVCKELRAVFRHGLAISPKLEELLCPPSMSMKLSIEGLLKIHR